MVAPSFEYYYKPMKKGGAKTAVLMMNNGHQLMGKDGGKLESPSYHNHGHSGTTPSPVDLTLDFKDIPGISCTRCHVRDVWKERDLGDFDGSYVAKGVAPHAAPFLVITPSVMAVRDHALLP